MQNFWRSQKCTRLIPHNGLPLIIFSLSYEYCSVHTIILFYIHLEANTAIHTAVLHFHHI